LKKFDDRQTDIQTLISHLDIDQSPILQGYKLHWLQAISGAKNITISFE